MPIPLPEERGKLLRAPVIYALLQVRWPRIPNMIQKADDIHDILRKEYPDSNLEVVEEILMTRDGASAQRTLNHWQYRNMEKDLGYSISENHCTFHVTRYTRFADFLDHAIKVLSVVQEKADPTHVERIGLRFIDAIIPDEGKGVRDYLDSNMLGIDFAVDGYEQLQSKSQKILKPTPAGGTMVISCTARGGQGVVFPDDLQPLVLKSDKLRNIPEEGEKAVLDTDHYYSETMSFDVEAIREKVLDLHNGVSDVFWGSITSFAIDSWRK